MKEQSKELLTKLVNKNENTPNPIKERYYKGDHWGEYGETFNMRQLPHLKFENLNESLITTSGDRTIFYFFLYKKDRIKPITINLIRNWVNKLTNLIKGEETNLIKTENKEDIDFINNKTNLSELYTDMINIGLLNGDFYIQLISTNNKIEFKIFDTKEVEIEEDENWNIISVAYNTKIKVKGEKKKFQVIEDISNIRVYEGYKLILDEPNTKGFISFFKIDVEEIINRDIINLQDQINIYETLLKYKVLWWVSPLQYITGLTNSDYKTLKDNSSLLGGVWSINALPWASASINISQLNGLDDFSLQKAKTLRRDFWNTMKLEGIIDNKDNWSSWKALLLKQIDTKSFINSFRNDFYKGILSILTKLNNYNIENWKQIDVEKLILNKTVWDLIEKETELQKKIDNEDRKIDLLEKWAGYFLTLWNTQAKSQELAQEKIGLLFK